MNTIIDNRVPKSNPALLLVVGTSADTLFTEWLLVAVQWA